MDWRTVRFDWNRARAFLVTAEEGSLSAAARALRMSQPTLGRQVAALEEELGVALFERVGGRLSLTQGGLELAEHARGMGDAAIRMSVAASGQSQSVEGHVCISATEVGAAFILPPIVARLRRDFPGITLEVVASNTNSDLRRREADIAIRGVRPADPDLIARRLRNDTAALYAAQSYLDAAGELHTPDALSAATFVGFAENEAFLKALNKKGLALEARNFPVLCGSHLAQWELVKQGLGIGVMVSRVGDAEPAVRRAAPWLRAFEFEVWLVAHRELDTSRRIRLVFDRLADELNAL